MIRPIQMIQKMNAYIEFELGGCPGVCCKNIEMDKLVHYKGNRLVVFDAYLPHQAQPVSRECYELRSVVVFKCVIDGGNRERLDFYKNAINDGKYKVEWR